jgi:hypothetical protein
MSLGFPTGNDQIPTQQQLDAMAGGAIEELVNLRAKQFCLERSQTINMEFDECYVRTRFLNFKYFKSMMEKDLSKGEAGA